MPRTLNPFAHTSLAYPRIHRSSSECAPRILPQPLSQGPRPLLAIPYWPCRQFARGTGEGERHGWADRSPRAIGALFSSTLSRPRPASPNLVPPRPTSSHLFPPRPTSPHLAPPCPSSLANELGWVRLGLVGPLSLAGLSWVRLSLAGLGWTWLGLAGRWWTWLGSDLESRASSL